MKRALTLLLMCIDAQATSVPSLSLEALIDQSEVIVHGRVARSWPAWDGGHKYIWTHHLIEVIDPLRGAVAGSVVASEPGGELDGIGMNFSGALSYAAGEETIVFLYKTPIGYWRATGYGQGKYSITPEMRVRANLKGLDLLKRGPVRGVALSALDGMTVSDFKARVREAIRSRR